MGIRTKFNPMGGTAGVKMVTLTVVTTPSDATCTLTYNGQTYNTKNLSVEEGSTVAYSISATGYTTQSGSWIVSSDTTQTITLNKQTYLLTVITSPANADCRLYYNGEYYYQKTLTVEYGATVSYYVYGVTGYGTKSGSWTITSTTTETVELSPILYTLTVSTNPSNATCTLTYGGSSYSSKSATVASGTVINYSVYHSTYGTTTGSITMNSNKTLTCTGTSSTSSQEVSWTRPNLTSNGTLGGSSFAVEASSEYSTTSAAWKAFDGDTTNNGRWSSKAGTTAANTGAYLIFYNPTAIKVSKLQWYNYTVQYTHYPNTLTLYGSNTNGSWSQIATGSGSAQPIATLNANSTTFYKYHKLAVTKTSSASNSMTCLELVITAKYLSSTTTYSWSKTVT